MAQVPRPPKQGNVTTYVAKVAAGYARILAGEVDADLDTIYGAWNGGADTVNLRDGCVTSAKLAADAVGPREIADGGIFTVALADGAVTTPKLADGAVTSGKLATGAVTSAQIADGTIVTGDIAPNGIWGETVLMNQSIWAANKLGIGSITTALIGDGQITSAKIADGTITSADIAPGAISVDKLPDGSVTGSKIAADTLTGAHIADGTLTTGDLVDGAVTRAKLAPGALPGAAQFATITSFYTNVLQTWIPVKAVTLTTRGANAVFLFTNHALNGFTTAPGNMALRWTRNGAHLCNTAFSAEGSGLMFPVVSLPWLDVVPSAGTYTYELQVLLQTGIAYISFNAANAGCGIAAIEVG
jgi:hypothetical protein